jgi:type IV pilus assembly protein PilY1
MVLFGTGRYLGITDVINTDTQTFYGIWDNVEPITSALSRSDLQEQIFCEAGNPDNEPSCETLDALGNTVQSGGAFVEGDSSFRVSSARTVTYSFTDSAAKRGWYIDLDQNAGERVVGDPLLIGSRILFTSIQPDDDPCLFGGTSWLNILNPITGARPKESFVTCCGEDTDGQLITETTTGFPPSGIEITGIASAPNVMKATDLETGSKFNAYVSTSEGKVEHISIAGGELGRQSWRQLELQ